MASSIPRKMVDLPVEILEEILGTLRQDDFSALKNVALTCKTMSTIADRFIWSAIWIRMRGDGSVSPVGLLEYCPSKPRIIDSIRHLHIEVDCRGCNFPSEPYSNTLEEAETAFYDRIRPFLKLFSGHITSIGFTWLCCMGSHRGLKSAVNVLFNVLDMHDYPSLRRLSRFRLIQNPFVKFPTRRPMFNAAHPNLPRIFGDIDGAEVFWKNFERMKLDIAPTQPSTTRGVDGT